MMKLFEEKPVCHTQIDKPEFDKSVFIKRNLLRGVTRSDVVREGISNWLESFEGAISKSAFEAQIKRLDWDDNIAVSQLKRAIGRRVIPLPPPPKKPPLDRPLMEQMITDSYVAVYGRKFRPAIREVVKELKTCGTVYVLQVEDLILEFKSYNDKGKAPQMIDQAIDCDFLVVVDLEMAIHLEWHIREAIERIGRIREERHKPIISTWNRFNDCNAFFERFKIYIVE